MRRVARFAVAAGWWLSIAIVASAAVFHGTDDETGKKLSRTAVDTIARAGEIKIGLKITHFADGPCMVAFSSLNDDLPKLDASTAALVIDGQRVPLAFDKMHDLVVVQGLAAVHELHFQPLDAATLAKLLDAKSLSLSIASPDGTTFKQDLAKEKLADVQEVVRGSK
jgi:hypothetical protein